MLTLVVDEAEPAVEVQWADDSGLYHFEFCYIRDPNNRRFNIALKIFTIHTIEDSI